MSQSVAVLNYGVGNLGSVLNMLKRIGVDPEVVSSPEELVSASRVILPGVGAFDHGINTLRTGGWDEAVRGHVSAGRPLLGICLGMQLLLDSSDEGEQPGFGFIPGTAKRFASQPDSPVPHMGWNTAMPAERNSLFAQQRDAARYYFVHSYYAVPEVDSHVAATTDYGVQFASAVLRDNVMGTQFHPEKSHRYGMEILENFSRL